MFEGITYADLWALLRRLGYDCDTLGTNPLGARNTVRVCEHPSGSSITLADYPSDQPVRPELLSGVRGSLDNFGLMTPEEFDRWSKRQARAHVVQATNGTPNVSPARSRRRSGKSA